jgi:hypothetical protein
MKVLYTALIVVLAVAISCTKSSVRDTLANDSSLAAKGGGSSETTEGIAIPLNTCYNTIQNTDSIRVCFDAVLVDCRCPRKVTCVWAGYAEVQLTITVNGVTETVALSTLGPNSTIVAGYEFTFLDLLPYPVYGVVPAPGDIKAVISIHKI